MALQTQLFKWLCFLEEQYVSQVSQLHFQFELRELAGLFDYLFDLHSFLFQKKFKIVEEFPVHLHY